MSFNTILDKLVSEIPGVPSFKQYWLIRTKSGQLYDTFIDNNFVGLEHTEVPLSKLKYLTIANPDRDDFLHSLKEEIKSYYGKRLSINEDDVTTQKVGLIAGQINRFYNDVKEGDIVIIPSYNSELVSFGEITENAIADFTDVEKRGLDNIHQFLNKRVNWIADFSRKSLDPNIFRMFTSHQAISNVSKYAEVIERSLQDFFILDNEAHLIINVQTRYDIKAKDLFGLGSSFLGLIDELSKEYGIEGVSSDDFEVTINLNSPGKINLKSKIKKGTFWAGFILLICGGGYVATDGSSLKTEGVKSLLDAISDYKDRNADRDLKLQMFNKYKDSLHIKNPEDLIKLMKQVDGNKDLPK